MALKEKCLCVIGADPDSIFPSDDNIIRFDYKMDYGMLLVKAGVFKAVKEAWKANYTGSVPGGWTDAIINGNQVYIYNPPHLSWAPASSGHTIHARSNDLPWHDAQDDYAQAVELDEEGRFDPMCFGFEHMPYGKWQGGS